jgi:hypothetical protein
MLRICISKYEKNKKLIRMMKNRSKEVQEKNQANHSRKLQKLIRKNKGMIVHNC